MHPTVELNPKRGGKPVESRTPAGCSGPRVNGRLGCVSKHRQIRRRSVPLEIDIDQFGASRESVTTEMVDAVRDCDANQLGALVKGVVRDAYDRQACDCVRNGYG